MLLAAPAEAQQTRRPAAKPAAKGYHNTRNPRAKARSGAYARYDRSNRRDEENLRLAPGMRLNMPAPPTTDYMGRPLKKKTPAKPATAGNTSLSSSAGTSPAPAAKKPAPRRR